MIRMELFKNIRQGLGEEGRFVDKGFQRSFSVTWVKYIFGGFFIEFECKVVFLYICLIGKEINVQGLVFNFKVIDNVY